ncbi:hypothetical protein B0J13DRAFT_490605 [Dactylonectria estremocensis]|uniref:Fe2OG dioxygenase domain-containing protein n=1 Tax=Dactylonectria estremocensis TaxID=1079267 RepID=A0A9P9FIF0_9HYPO|nr:hypothetical protein B0J13DRAFT_490605 [Dactylonectria estremocensis]
MAAGSIPSIDFSASGGSDTAAFAALVDRVRNACQSYGFFQLTNHGIPQSSMDEILECSKEFFSLPLEEKEKYDKDLAKDHRGYERLRAQNFEKRGEGDLKEGYYFGLDLPEDHPQVLAKKFNLGPNKYPENVKDPQEFRQKIDSYIEKMIEIAERLIRILCKTLEVDDGWVSQFTNTPIATLRLLHYPPQPPDASELERGIGAHTDFGAVTILLQDLVGGLQVWDRACSQWIDVEPTKGAFVVNLGNLMMRWTNDRYVSNLHRVINKSGQARYSVPFFFAGNPDFLVECFESCQDLDTEAKYPPTTVGDWMSGRYADTYGTSEVKATKDLFEDKAGLA